MLKGHKWNFIHIPKCGGMALRSILEPLSICEFGDFMPLGTTCAVRSQLHRIPRKRPTGAVFTVVRHPAAWLRSYYLDQSPERIGVTRYLHRFWADDLDQFVANVCEGSPGYVGKLFDAHIRYSKVRVFRLEDGLSKVLSFLGIDAEVPHINGSADHPQMNKDSLSLIALTEKAAIKRFGYESR